MNKLIINIALLLLLAGCVKSNTEMDNHNSPLKKLITSNKILTKRFNTIFDQQSANKGVFKILVSRRDKFVRITIYQLINKDEISETPSSYFTYNSKIFLCYDGSEIIANKFINDKFMAELKAKMESGFTNDSRIFQFDIDQKKHIYINVPAINPFDFINKMDTVNFAPQPGASMQRRPKA